MNFLAVLADELIFGSPIEFGRNTLALLVVRDAVGVGTLYIVEVVDGRRHIKAHFLYHMLILYYVDSAARCQGGQAFHALYSELSVSRAEDDTFHLTWILMGSCYPFAPLSIELKGSDYPYKLLPYLSLGMATQNVVNDQAVGNRLYPFGAILDRCIAMGWHRHYEILGIFEALWHFDRSLEVVAYLTCYEGQEDNSDNHAVGRLDFPAVERCGI